jgi:electron transfer flavoprotein beta subunit
MKSVVCIKRVPDTETKVRVGGDGKSLDSQGVNFVLNPYDEYAVEEAIRIREKHEGEVTVVCLGPKECAPIIRNALAMGADKGVHLLDDEPERDPMSVARSLADGLKEMEFDVLLFGRMAVDDQSAQVGSAVAHLLGLPVAIDVTGLEIEDGKAKIHRSVDAETYVLEAPLPLAITANKGLNDPRYPSLKGIMAAKKKPLEEKEATKHPVATKVSQMAHPPARQAGKIVGKGADAVPELVRLLHEEAKMI